MTAEYGASCTLWSTILVNRKKVRVGDLPVEIESTLEDAAGAVLFRPTQLFDGFVGTKQRQHRRPAQPAVCGRAFLGQPAVVGRGQGPFGFRVAGIVADEKSREDDLHVYAHLVHVGEAARHVLELSQDPGRMVDFVADGAVLQPAFNHPAAAVRRIIAGSFGLIGRHRNRHRDVLRVGSSL